MYNLNTIYSQILKNGISAERVENREMNQYGKIAVANSKQQMISNKGYTVGSVETLLSNANVVTHFTPNVYHFLSRKNNVVTGHEEQNLKQINAFVIDFDNPRLTVQDILSEAINIEIMPSLVVKSDKGFHAYFILDKPVYVTAKTQYRSLKIAKRISKNLRLAFSENIQGVDLTCNHFGYFRCPNKNNIEYYNDHELHNFKELMEWSKRKADDTQQHLKLIVDNSFNTKQQQIKEGWYRELIKQSSIHAGNGYGRNNTVFTLSLANYQSDVDIERCLDEMDLFNSALEFPLPHHTVENIVKSAYSGKYRGAQKEYINELMSSWCNDKKTSKAFNVWYKFKKKREDRKNSHAFEREQDILEYLEAHQSKGYIAISLRSLAEHFNISLSALQNVISQSNILKIKVSGKGRATKTYIYTFKSILKHVIATKKQKTAVNPIAKQIILSMDLKELKVVEKMVLKKPQNQEYQGFKQERLLL